MAGLDSGEITPMTLLNAINDVKIAVAVINTKAEETAQKATQDRADIRKLQSSFHVMSQEMKLLNGFTDKEKQALREFVENSADDAEDRRLLRQQIKVALIGAILTLIIVVMLGPYIIAHLPH